MIQGTTPTHVFYVNADLRGAKVYVTYKQGDRIIEKTNNDIIVHADSLIVPLNQGDTMIFDDNKPIKIQIRYVKKSGESSASQIMMTDIQSILKKGVISYE